jgi:hypothetical protein
MAAELGQHERAALLLGAAQHVREESSLTLVETHRPEHERAEAIAARGLGHLHDAAERIMAEDTG